MTSKVGLLSGGQRQALTLLMATLQQAAICCCSTSTRRRSTRRSRSKRAADHRGDRARKISITTMMVTHNIGARACQLRQRALIMLESRPRSSLDLSGETRDRLDVPGLLALYREACCAELDIDNDACLSATELRSRGDAVPPGYVPGSGETGGDTPLAPARQGRLGTRVPRQRSKSPAELDFYGEFYAALCGAPALPVLPSAKDGRGLRPAGARKGTLLACLFVDSFCSQNHKSRGVYLAFYTLREKVSVWELSDVRVLRSRTQLVGETQFRDSLL